MIDNCWHKRRMQFTAGPQQMTFYACPACSPDLVAGRVSCFRAIRDTPAMPANMEKARGEHCAICGIDIDGEGGNDSRS